MGDSPSDLSPMADDLDLLAQASRGYRKLTAQIGQVIVGQDAVVRSLLGALFAQGHTLIVGVPGLAKTLLVHTLADALGWDFKRIQFTPDMMPADIVGMELLQDDPSGVGRHMRFVPGPVFANLVLADEINRTPPKTQAALLEAMQERTVTSMGHVHHLQRPFVVVATQNPIEQEGTYPLPEAQLDRFMFSLRMDYPSAVEEEQIVLASPPSASQRLAPIFTQAQLLAFQDLVQRMPVSQPVARYAVALTRATRPGDDQAHPLAKRYVQWGAGPRASQHMVRAGQALAMLDGQPAVTADHIRQVAPHVLSHRVLPNYQALSDQRDAPSLVRHMIDELNDFCDP